MLRSGIRGTLSWGAEGLRIERGELREGNTLTIPWKSVSERLRGLAEANSYLDEAEKGHMDEWRASQEALWARQMTAAELSVLLTIYEPDRENLNASMEHLRAYAYENSDTARQALAGKLLELRALDRIHADAAALYELLHEATRNLRYRKRENYVYTSSLHFLIDVYFCPVFF